MIFNENYDRTLWLMIAGDKECRETVSLNIDAFPEEVYEYIFQQINKYSQYAKKGHKEDISLEDKYMTGSDGYQYVVCISIISGQLNLGVFRKSFSAGWSDLFQLSLALVTEEELVNMKNSDSIYLGKCSWVYGKGKNRVLHNSTYELKKKFFGFVLEYSNSYCSKYRIVDYLGKHPEEMHRSDFSSKEKVRALFRTRKNRRSIRNN